MLKVSEIKFIHNIRKIQTNYETQHAQESMSLPAGIYTKYLHMMYLHTMYPYLQEQITQESICLPDSTETLHRLETNYICSL